MSDLRTNLERLGERVSPARDAMEHLERRRSRRERTTRVATAIFALSIAVAGSLGAYLALREPKATQAVGVGAPSSSTPTVAAITCDGSTTTVETPTVVAQADGVHLTVTNTGSDDLGIQFDATGRGDNATVGETSLLVPIAPGTERVRCFGPNDDTGAPGGWQDLTVTDPDGFYGSPQLDCESGQMGSGISDYAPGAKGVADPVAAAGGFFSDQFGPSGEVVPAGYPEDPNHREFVFVTDGKAVASVSYEPDGTAGWLQATTSECG